MKKGPIGNPIKLSNGQTVPFSPAYRLGNQLFISGQLAFDQDNNIVGDTIEEQTKQCMDNLNAILVGAGSSLSQVVKATAWITNPSNFQGFNSVYASYFSNGFPARATLLSELVLPSALVEIEAIAFVE